MKILLFDIETSYMLGKVWGLHKGNEVRSMSMIKRNWSVLCWCAKWLDNNRFIVSSLPDDPKYKENYLDDKMIMQKLWELMDEADVIIAHNANAFDVKKANTRFLIHGMTPPSPYKVIDTLLIARRYFKFPSNKLDDLGNFLGVGRKIPTGGIDLWDDCEAGDPKAWKKMIKYCKQDVLLLERVYLKLLPYITNHPNQNYYNIENKHNCPKCNSDNTHRRGYLYLASGKKQRMKCNNCGGWSTLDKKSAKNAI